MSRILLVSFLAGAVACTKAPPTPAKQPDAGAKSNKPGTPAQRPAPVDIPAPPDVAAPPADAERTASGLGSKVLQAGTGTEKPTEWDEVTVHYTGWTTDGKMFDSSKKRNKPATFKLKNVIPGWTEGLQLMVAGEQRRFWIPVELAYNNKPGKPKGMLVFDVELLAFKAGPKPIPAPPDVAAPPANAEKTKSGLASRVLLPAQKGQGKGKKPKATDVVKVHYTGWTTDGKMFDSSVQRGKAATFQLDQVIAGWTEGVQLMALGEQRRFWIPQELAYKGQEGAPKGMLVFDIELLEIVDLSAPADVAAPPKDAEKSASGLTWKVLKKGTGDQHPTAQSRVVAEYTGWTTDGKMFDSSRARGEPLKFPLARVIPGWTEGVQLMVPGEKRRFWIPEDLAYKGKQGAPKGMLVFDIELISFE